MSDMRGHDRVALSIDPRGEAGGARASVERPFRILVVGDFSGSDAGARAPRQAIAERRPLPVAHVDEALDALRPTVDLDVAGGARVTLELTELDDFHPDRLIARVPWLRDLVSSIDARIEEARAAAGGRDEAKAGPAAEPEGAGGAGPAPAGLLDDIVAAAPERAEGRASGPLGDLHGWLGEVVAPHLERPSADEEPDVRRRVEADVSDRVRALLHHPAVRALERAWRSLFFLSRAVDPDPDTRLHLLDLSRRDVASMLADGEPGASPLFRVLTESLPGPGGDTPVGLLVACYDFGPEPADVLLLNRLAVIAHLTGAPLLAGAHPALLGLDSFAELPEPGAVVAPPPAWAAFRETEAARSVALLAPRFLLREPYGADAEPCEALGFEELDGAGAGAYLWGNAALVGAAAAAQAFAREGWSLDLEDAREVDELPIHVTPDGVGAHPTEALWPVDVVELALDAGVSPLVGYREQTRVRLPAVASVARPRGPLARWWSG